MDFEHESKTDYVETLVDVQPVASSERDLPADVSGLCRACCAETAPSSGVSLFHVNLAKKLMKLTGVQAWQADGLPGRICHVCIVKLDASYSFMKQCEASDSRLRQHVTKIQAMQQPLPRPEVTLHDDRYEANVYKIESAKNNRRSLNNEDPKRGHQCNVCFKIFVTPSKLLRHHDYIHSSQRRFKCELCKKSFSQNSNLKAHMKVHTEDRPYVCHVCKKACKRSKDLELHIRTHTGEKPHVCNTCGRAFSSFSNLVAHNRTHTGEKPYVCSVCQKAFCQSGELTRHKKIHAKGERSACEICNKEFGSSSALVAHVMTHDGERMQNLI